MIDNEAMTKSLEGARTSTYTWATALALAAVIAVMIFVLGAITLLPAAAPRAPFALAALPHLVVFVLLLRSRHPGPATWGWVRGVALATQWILIFSALVSILSIVFVLLLGMLPVMMLLLRLSTVIGNILLLSGPAGMSVLGVLLATQYVAGRIARHERAGTTEASENTSGLHSILSFSAVVVLAILGAAFAANTVASAQSHATALENATRRDIAGAVPGVVQVQKCALTMAKSDNAHGYPRSIAAMGASGGGCIDSLTAVGVRYGSVIRYLPATVDSTRPVDHYWVMSRDASGLPGTPAYLGDDAGQVFEARYSSRWGDGGPDSLAPLRVMRSPVKQLRSLAACIVSTYRSSSGEYPVDLSHAEPRQPARECVNQIKRNHGEIFADPADAAGGGLFLVEYSPGPVNPRRGSPTTFMLRARPRFYGETSIRSFLLDTAGAVHFTTEQRDATIRDPKVFGCEAENQKSCSVALATLSR